MLIVFYSSGILLFCFLFYFLLNNAKCFLIVYLICFIFKQKKERKNFHSEKLFSWINIYVERTNMIKRQHTAYINFYSLNKFIAKKKDANCHDIIIYIYIITSKYIYMCVCRICHTNICINKK